MSTKNQVMSMTGGLGPAAQAFLDLELARTDLLRMKDALKEARK